MLMKAYAPLIQLVYRVHLCNAFRQNECQLHLLINLKLKTVAQLLPISESGPKWDHNTLVVVYME